MTSRNQKVTAGIVVAVVLVLVSQLFAGDPQTITVKPGMIEIRLPSVPSAADVTWESRQPLTLDYKTYDTGTVLSTHSSYAVNGEIIVVSDVIDWDARKRDKTTWIVKIDGAAPTPVPPVPPAPTPVTGFALEIYNAVKPIGEAPKAKLFAANYDTVVSEIGAGALQSIASIRARIIELNRPLQAQTRDQRWWAVGKLIDAKLATVSTAAQVKDVFEQVAIGLHAAGAVQ
jgi:hypothetical protein